MDLQEILRWRQEAGGFNHHCGIQVTGIGEGTADVEVEVAPEMLNPIGMAHGGFIYTLCDVASGTAAASRGRVAVTLSGVINYLRPGRPAQRLRARASEIKSGRKTAVYIVDVSDAEGKLIATSTFTMFYTGQTVSDMQCLAD